MTRLAEGSSSQLDDGRSSLTRSNPVVHLSALDASSPCQARLGFKIGSTAIRIALSEDSSGVPPSITSLLATDWSTLTTWLRPGHIVEHRRVPATVDAIDSCDFLFPLLAPEGTYTFRDCDPL